MTNHDRPRLKEDISPNLVPMIDIMFLLLLFFMLGADMAQRETVELPLPRADQVRIDPVDEPGPLTTANVHHLADVACASRAASGSCQDAEHWSCAIQGHEYPLSGTAAALERQLRIEATEFLEERAPGAQGPTPSKRRLLVRADRDAPYGSVQKLIEVAGSCGLYKVELAAARPAARPERR